MAEKVPRLVAGFDIRKLKLDPTDGFLLTRIDGRQGPKQLARDTGLPDFSVDRALEKLEKLGAVEWIDPDAPPPPKGPAKAPALPEFTDLAEPKYDPKELEEESDLAPEQRKRVLGMFYRLDDLDHWTLLGITREADKKAVKRAYFELASVMHPDRYFKKNLGSFKSKMEILFARITEAHDTLLDPVRKAEYEIYLAEVATTRGMEAMFERALEESQRAAAAAAGATQSSPGATTAGSAPQVAPPGPTGPSDAEVQARRQALARRLLGQSAGARAAAVAPKPPPVEVPNPHKYANSQDAVDALKRRYEDRMESATISQARRHIQAGEDALAKKDVVAAASAFSLAMKFAPNDTALALRQHEVKAQADKLLTESYTKQAQYEEKAMKWPEAARNWSKVARLSHQDPKPHERAAHAILKAEGDLHDAAEHAKQAVALDPSVAHYHVILADIYYKAGLTASARRAAEAGLQVDPENATLQTVLKKIGK